MKIAIIGAAGKAGQAILQAAQEKGLDVTAIHRHEDMNFTGHDIHKGLFDLTKEDLAGFDAVINAFAVWNEADFALHSEAMRHLLSLLAGTKTRLLVVGGAGSLYVNPEQTMQLWETPDFPAAYYPLAKAMAESLGILRDAKDVDWTYVSPAAEFIADGPRTGQYVRAGEVFTTNADGQSQISYADYGIGFVEEVMHPTTPQGRISLRW